MQFQLLFEFNIIINYKEINKKNIFFIKKIYFKIAYYQLIYLIINHSNLKFIVLILFFLILIYYFQFNLFL